MKRSGGIAGRPMAHLSVTELEALVKACEREKDELTLVLAELGHRKTKRATDLKSLTERLLRRLQSTD